MQKIILAGLSGLFTMTMLNGCTTSWHETNPPPMQTTNPSTCVPEQAVALVGQSNLSEAQIKQKTQAERVRMVYPGQAVTMDYREDRVTVTLDPLSKKIIQAACG
jgi:hypothetical protein